MSRYKNKPVVVEAFQYDGDFINRDGDYYVPHWVADELASGNMYFKNAGELYIKTLEGEMYVSVDDYIIKDVQGEIYPCKPDVFEQTYGRED